LSALPVSARARRRLRHNPLARSLRATVLTGVDALERIVVPCAPDCPPRRLRGVGAGDFRAVGNALVDQLVLTAGLRPDHHVIDIGCGSGRLALPLAGYLRGGRYEGFDIDPQMIEWCKRAITPRHPQFRFSLLDVANTHYNPGGALSADDVRFPFASERFDMAVATSLFTHLLPASVVNYASEAARVLAAGGMLFATFCVVDDGALERIARGEAHVDLRHRLHDADGIEFHTSDPASPETAIGFGEPYVRSTFAAAGLNVSAIHRGTWSGRPDGFSFQDVVIAERAAARAAA
jgi:SAM-dependent methyltransferase